MFPIKRVQSLEDFLINRFGKELYKTFFKDYTEKIWGVPCNKISQDWGAKRIKKLSISRALIHALRSTYKKDSSFEQKNTDNSLIEQFMYPKFGPGQMWNTVAEIIEDRGGIIIKNAKVSRLDISDNRVSEVTYFDSEAKSDTNVIGDYFLSTMPIKELIRFSRTAAFGR